MSSFQQDVNHINNLQSQFSGLKINDDITLYRQYNMLVKQGMSKREACDALKARPGTIDHIRKSYNLQSAHYFVQRRKRLKKKKEESTTENKKKIKEKLNG
jgi:hypothetical protein